MAKRKSKLLALMMICVICASGWPVSAQEPTLELEALTQIEQEYERILDAMQQQRDAALRNADAAERNAAANAEAARVFRHLFEAERARNDQPRVNRWVWFALGAASALIGGLTTYIIVK